MQGRWATVLLAYGFCLCAHAETPSPIEAVVAPPIFHEMFACTEHYAGQLKGLGDDLGTDCMVMELVEEDDRTWLRSYRGDGRRNEDWFGWQADVLSPCDCTVGKIDINPVTNSPGQMGHPPASWVMLVRDDGVHFMLAHVESMQVKVGDKVKAQQVIAKVGNNGYARAPHIHVGAWRDSTPLQIRWDQRFFGSSH